LSPKEKNLIIICGPTAVGKSSTAIRLAHAFGGEIISCDSMQVYRGFDIGTDKPSVEQRKGIPHHLIDVVGSSEQFTAAEFVAAAPRIASEILARGRLPMIVGGTGLYLKALCDGLFPGPGRVPGVRRQLEEECRAEGLERLYLKLREIDPKYARKIGPHDRIRTIRALEVLAVTGKPMSEHFLETKSLVEDFHLLLVGLRLERSLLAKRIEERVDRMFERGIVGEVRRLLGSGVGEDSPPFRALGYRQVLRHVKGEISLEDAMASTKIETRHYAKRQMTWFKKTRDVNWFSGDDFTAVAAFLKTRIK
jgi:tRNA dimethylallyltransferase